MDEQTVKYVATLARLSLDERELTRLAADLATITDYLGQLQKVDVEGVPMTVHPAADRNQWRADEAQPGFSREQAVANAPESEQNFFKVPPVIE
jgi:aspartyl-tRNA(Asn)/glutamyl-tRNA(Gln) amidotransferase subunit C